MCKRFEVALMLQMQNKFIVVPLYYTIYGFTRVPFDRITAYMKTIMTSVTDKYYTVSIRCRKKYTRSCTWKPSRRVKSTPVFYYLLIIIIQQK